VTRVLVFPSRVGSGLVRRREHWKLKITAVTRRATLRKPLKFKVELVVHEKSSQSALNPAARLS